MELARDFSHETKLLIHKDTNELHRRKAWTNCINDLARIVCGDAALTLWRKIQADHLHANFGTKPRVRCIRDAADFDQRFSAQASNRRASIFRAHERLADEKPAITTSRESFDICARSNAALRHEHRVRRRELRKLLGRFERRLEAAQIAIVHADHLRAR